MPNRIKNTFSWGTQNHRLLERLILGPIRSREIVFDLGILSYDQVLGDVRKAVRKQGGDVVSEPQDRRRTDWENRLIQPGQQGLFLIIGEGGDMKNEQDNEKLPVGWTTKHEIEFLRDVGKGQWNRDGNRNRDSLLAQYRRAAMKRDDWGKIEPKIVLAYLALESRVKL